MYAKRKLIAGVSALAILSMSGCSVFSKGADNNPTPSPTPAVSSPAATEKPTEKPSDNGSTEVAAPSVEDNGSDLGVWYNDLDNDDTSGTAKSSSAVENTVTSNAIHRAANPAEKAAEAVHSVVTPKWAPKKTSGSVVTNKIAHKSTAAVNNANKATAGVNKANKGNSTPSAPQTLSPTAPKPAPKPAPGKQVDPLPVAPDIEVKPAPTPTPAPDPTPAPEPAPTPAPTPAPEPEPAPKPTPAPVEDLVPWFNESEYSKALADWNVLIESSKESFRNNQAALAEAEKDLATAKSKYDAASALRNTLLGDLNNAQTELDRVLASNSSKIESATKRYQEAKSHYESVLSAIQHYSNQVKDAEQRISSANALTASLIQQQSAAAARVDQAKQSLETAQTTLTFDIATADQATKNRFIGDALMERINEYRVVNGLHELVSSEAFNDAAEAWSKEMVKSGVLEHSTGSFRGHDGENVARVSLQNAKASEVVDLAFNGWTKSFGHNAVMLSESVSAAGMGVGFDSSTNTYYITNKFYVTAHEKTNGSYYESNPLLEANRSKLYTPDGSASEVVGSEKSRFESVAKPKVDPAHSADYSTVKGGKSVLDLTTKAEEGTDSRLENLGSPDPVAVSNAQRELQIAQSQKAQADSNLSEANKTKATLVEEKASYETKLSEVKAEEPAAADAVTAAKENLEQAQKVVASEEVAAVEEAQEKVDAQKPEYDEAKAEYEAEVENTKAAAEATEKSEQKLANDIASKPTEEDHTEMITKAEEQARLKAAAEKAAAEAEAKAKAEAEAQAKAEAEAQAKAAAEAAAAEKAAAEAAAAEQTAAEKAAAEAAAAEAAAAEKAAAEKAEAEAAEKAAAAEAEAQAAATSTESAEQGDVVANA